MTQLSKPPHFCTVCRSQTALSNSMKLSHAMWEIWVPFLGQEDPLKKGMATHSSILAWRIPQTEEAGGLQSMGSYRIGHDCATNTRTFIIDLQCRANLCCTTKQLLYTYLRSFLYSFPLWFITDIEYIKQFSVLYIKTFLLYQL